MHGIQYSIVASDPAAHLFQVCCHIETPAPEGQVVSLPAWIPGSYTIRDFARHIVTIEAESDGKPLAMEKRDKDSWWLAPCDGPVTIHYRVYAFDLSVRAAYLDGRRGFFNGTSVFLRAQGQEDRPCTLRIEPPREPDDWQAATAMAPVEVGRDGFGLYEAADYDELIDHPVEMGRFSRAAFEACGVRHEVLLAGRHRCDMDRLCRDLKAICEHHIRFFGEPAPVDRYVFLVAVLGEGYGGGLEHRASCSLMCDRGQLPLPGEAGVSDGYRDFLGLCSHEYFHTWNVKRIKPEAFTPYDLQRENYTELLWAFEGITVYYEDLALVRAGLVSHESYLELLGRTITRVMRHKGRFRQTVADSSFYAWTKFYKQDENAPNAIVSYYGKGALVALCLDFEIRRASGGEQSLDDVMRLLWQRYGAVGRGVPERGVEAAAAEVAGRDLGEFFDRALRGTEDLPLQRVLAEAGVDCCFRAAESQQDPGGRPARAADGAGSDRPVELGARFQSENGYPKLQVVFEDGAAQAAGLAAGDVLVALDGLRLSESNLDKRLRRYAPGESVSVHAFRGDELLELSLTLRAPAATTCYLRPDPDAGETQQVWRARWLDGPAGR